MFDQVIFKDLLIMVALDLIEGLSSLGESAVLYIPIDSFHNYLLQRDNRGMEGRDQCCLLQLDEFRAYWRLRDNVY